MTAAVMRVAATAKPGRAVLERIESVLTIALVVQTIGLAPRYGL